MCETCIKLIIDKNDKRSWDEQKLDWSLEKDKSVEYDYIALESKPLEDETNKKELSTLKSKPNTGYCICGHPIAKPYYVYNSKLKLCYQMGSVCICRYKKNDTSDKGVFTGNQEMEDKMRELQKFHCDICNKTMNIERVMKHNDSPMHKKKYKMKNFRMCKICKDYKIEKIKPSYYHTCSRCYKFVPKKNL